MTATPSNHRPGPATRGALLDVTNRLNNPSLQHLHDQIKRKSYRAPEVVAVLGEGRVDTPENSNSHRHYVGTASDHEAREPTSYYNSSPYDPSPSTIRDARSERAFSSRSPEGYKTHVGPWQLGKSLGKGSTGMVRLCRHRITQQLAAVKIVPKDSRRLVQAGSLTALDKLDGKRHWSSGELSIPVAIEREVAILKLIQHENITKLYDIWENGDEIYLVLEYIDNGDLYTHIMHHGPQAEEVAVDFFRQIMSAISYCHSFNICHRDLKPENILLTSDGHVKIADFRMAALHQTTGHYLRTACGSPHYAAPELWSAKQYRGDKADIWSMGVILYAMLVASLPFDHQDMEDMMIAVKRGEYEMPQHLSPKAKDLIRRILQVNPDRRIAMEDMWNHPLIQKYEYVDNFRPQARGIGRVVECKPLRGDEIDPQLVRQLRSLWHSFSEQELRVALMSDEPNDQKVFYGLLQDYREKQLEDFNPEIAHSRSDYHHLKPTSWKKHRTTCEFTNPGQGRLRGSVSRFTVISRIAETDTETAESYDPFNASRTPLQRRPSQISRAKVTVHRQPSNRSRREGFTKSQISRASIPSGSTVGRVHGRRGPRRSTVVGYTPKTMSTLSSVTSWRSRPGSYHARKAPLRHKRGVDFSQLRALQAAKRGSGFAKGGSIYSEDNSGTPRPDSGVLPCQRDSPIKDYKRGKQKQTSPPVLQYKERVPITREELRKFSSGLAKDCDKAFGSSLIAEPSIGDSLGETVRRRSPESTPIALTFGGGPMAQRLSSAPRNPFLDRPLPPLPLKVGGPTAPQTDTKDASSKDASGGKPRSRGEKLVSQLNRLSIPLLNMPYDRRVASAPTSSAEDKRKGIMMPSNEKKPGTGMLSRAMNDLDDRGRIVSDPSAYGRPQSEYQAGSNYLSNIDDTIKVVDCSPLVAKSEPLTERRGSNASYKLEPQNLRRSSVLIAQDFAPSGGPGSIKNMKIMETRRLSQLQQTEPIVGGLGMIQQGTLGMRRVSAHMAEAPQPSGIMAGPAHTPKAESYAACQEPVLAKKKKFGLLFWKSAKPEPKMSIAGPEYNDKPVLSERVESTSALNANSTTEQRNIEVHPNWLARLFRVKPATAYICSTLSRKRARQEITLVLKQWRKYGIRDVEIDRERDIVFARVGRENYLGMKEVSFAVEIMTVIEHGNPVQLSIVRFTQERGAASSLHRVVKTMKEVFQVRQLLVADKRKAKMMIKTLNS